MREYVKAQKLASCSCKENCSSFNSPEVFQRPVLVDLIRAVLYINIEKL